MKTVKEAAEEYAMKIHGQTNAEYTYSAQDYIAGVHSTHEIIREYCFNAIEGAGFKIAEDLIKLLS